MYNKFQSAFNYLHYLLNASSGRGHGTHSPFVYDFIARVLTDKKHYAEYGRIEDLRKSLKADKTLITVEDYGAGSAVTAGSQRSIQSIAKYAAKSRKFGQLLFRMIRKYRPATILELGTSLGITSAYLATANPMGRVYTLEGASTLADKAREGFHQLNLSSIQVIPGNFDQTLEPLLDSLNSVDFAFIDGNHQREPTERYFLQILTKTHNDSILILDDIHWSQEMELAWGAILKHPSVRCSIDLFFMGIIFFRGEFREPQHFVIRF